MLKLKKDKLIAQKRVYIILLILLGIGIFLGLLYPLFLSNDNKELLTTSITSFFNNVSNNQLDYANGLKNSFFSNCLFLLGIWLLGISIIGLPIIILLLVIKGFTFGFSISSIISIYGFKGVIGAITYVFPTTILTLVVTLLLVFYSTSFSIKIFRYLFLKESLNFKPIMNKYFKILLICLLSYSVISLLEVYVQPVVMKLFTFFLK